MFGALYEGADVLFRPKKSERLGCILEWANFMAPGLDYAGDDPPDRSAWFDQRDTHIHSAVLPTLSYPS
jgi:hypothetical protein